MRCPLVGANSFAHSAPCKRGPSCAINPHYRVITTTMSMPTTLRQDIKVLAFDQYGTVVDIQGGLVAFATPFLAAKGWRGSKVQAGVSCERG